MSKFRWTRVSDGSYQIRVRVSVGMLVLAEVYQGTQPKRWFWYLTGESDNGQEETFAKAKAKAEAAIEKVVV